MQSREDAAKVVEDHLSWLAKNSRAKVADAFKATFFYIGKETHVPMWQDAVDAFLVRSGRDLRISKSGADWRVDVDGLPGTERSGSDLGRTVTECVIAFVVKDWQPRNAGVD